MATKIEWADSSWNPISGCSPMSAGCANCYASSMSKRLKGRFGYPQNDPFKVTFHKDKINEPDKWKKPRRVFTCSMGDLFHDDVTDGQIMWVFWKMARAKQHTFIVLTKRPKRMRRWFSKWLQKHLKGIDYTKYSFVRDPDGIRKTHKVGRALLLAEMLELWGEKPIWHVLPTYDSLYGIVHWPDVFPNVHIGVSVEDQKTADERIPHLLRCQAAVRFVSVEPLLGPINLSPFLPHKFNCEPHCTWCEDCIHSGKDDGWKETTKHNHSPFLDGVITGGETGPRARPMHPDWVRSIRDQCVDCGTNFFFKSWGQWQNGSDFSRPLKSHIVLSDGRHAINAGELGFRQCDGPEWNALNPTMMAKVGKKRSGRTLDGRTWDQLPKR
ncbi:MAG: phage Gp37/Gp68 family protein [FCB group bacterium]|nr:phage Gp37/Gp68 family protein [FCB group bacterium]